MPMHAFRGWKSVRNTLCALAGFVCAAPSVAPAGSSFQILHDFDDAGGGYPDTDLVMDGAGKLYGMTVKGGAFDGGTVFQLAPSAGGWVHTVIYDFTGGADGGQPYGGVTLDAFGNVYGTAVIGGSGGVCVEEGCGVVFELVRSGSTWTHTVIHDFTGGSDGFGPGGPVTFDVFGNLYGMTPTGGDFGAGTVFQLARQPDGSWKETILHSFTGGDDGSSASAGRLLVDADGSVFGVATAGGANGAGVVFRLRAAGGAAWDFKTIYAFKGAPDGVFPYGGLISDASGRLYGTTYYGGTQGVGAVYQLSPTTGGAWSERVLYSFTGGVDGASPISGLLFQNGSLYGTTSAGGASCDCGTLFRLRPLQNGRWKEHVLYRFAGTPDGAYAYAGLVADATGTLYGATVRGGDDDDGAVFAFKP